MRVRRGAFRLPSRRRSRCRLIKNRGWTPSRDVGDPMGWIRRCPEWLRPPTRTQVWPRAALLALADVLFSQKGKWESSVPVGIGRKTVIPDRTARPHRPGLGNWLPPPPARCRSIVSHTGVGRGRGRAVSATVALRGAAPPGGFQTGPARRSSRGRQLGRARIRARPHDAGRQREHAALGQVRSRTRGAPGPSRTPVNASVAPWSRRRARQWLAP